MKKALTIGELLITMAIIGVIAMLVLPGFLKDYHNRLYATKLRKTIETIEIAVNQACVDNNVSYFSQTAYSKASSAADQQAFIDKYFKKISSGTNKPFANEYRSINGTSKGSLNALEPNVGHAKLASGEAISMACLPNEPYCRFRIDVNSLDGPNVGGRDLFIVGVNKETNQVYEPHSVDTCHNNFSGQGCFGLLLEHNWEIIY